MYNNWTYSGTTTYPRMISKAYADLLQENEKLKERIDILQNINRDNHIIISTQHKELKELKQPLMIKPTFQYPTVVGKNGEGLIIVNAERTFLWRFDTWQNIPSALTTMFGKLKHYKSCHQAMEEWIDHDAVKRNFFGSK